MQVDVFFVALHGRVLEAFFVAALDPQRRGFFDRWRDTAGRVYASRNIVAGFDEPRLSVALFAEVLKSSLARTIDITGLPTNETRGKLALANRRHSSSPSAPIAVLGRAARRAFSEIFFHDFGSFVTSV